MKKITYQQIKDDWQSAARELSDAKCDYLLLLDAMAGIKTILTTAVASESCAATHRRRRKVEKRLINASKAMTAHSNRLIKYALLSRS